MATFLTAEWRALAMLNYHVDPGVLQPLVPHGTELDTFAGQTFVSLVGFLFANTRVLGVPIPAHRTFEEVNLRFYVRRRVGSETRRAVTFIKELVPRPLIATVARLAYNEPYQSAPMRHTFDHVDETGTPRSVRYEWRVGPEWSGLQLEATGVGTEPRTGSEEEFITEHYWGYTRQRDGATVEYRVEHPRWRVWGASSSRVFGDLAAVYGETLGSIFSKPPTSAFIADGSPVRVGWPARLPLKA